jgi:hypothetical protein
MGITIRQQNFAASPGDLTSRKNFLALRTTNPGTVQAPPGKMNVSQLYEWSSVFQFNRAVRSVVFNGLVTEGSA